MLNFLTQTFLLGLKNLRLHKLRSLLTALGIILGVAAVIVMVAYGEGVKQNAMDDIQHLGPKNILVQSKKPPESNQASNRTQRVLEYGLKRVDLERLKTLPGVEVIVPLRMTEQNVVLGDLRASADAIGTTPDIFNIINLELARGSYFNALQYERGEAVCVLGAIAARQLFPYQDPIGQTIQIGTSGQACTIVTVIGVLNPAGLRAGSEGAAMMNHDLDQGVYFPLTPAQTTLIETTVISLCGGLIGVAIGIGGSWLVQAITTHFSSTVFRMNVTLWSVLASFSISGLIGIGFGLYPAVTAAKMNPIDALRHE